MFPGALAIVPCLGVSLLIIAPQNKIRDFLSSKVPFLIGDWSYSIYLWHWPIMAAFRYYYSVEEFEVWQYFAVIILTIILSLASYYLIENPLRKSKGKVLYPAVLVLLAVGFGLQRKSLYINKIIGISIDEYYAKPNFGSESHNTGNIETFGYRQNENNFFLIGNSFATVQKPFLDYIGLENKFSFDTSTFDGFAPIEGFDYEDRLSGNMRKRHENAVTSVLPYIENADIIFFSFNYFYASKIHGDRDNQYEKPLSMLLPKLKNDQIFILITSYPYLDKNPITMNRAIVKKYDTNIESTIPKLSKKISNIIDAYPNAHFLDLTNTEGYKNTFKDAPYYNDTVMYYDALHINQYGALAYARETEKDFMHKLDSILLIHNKKLVNGELVEIE